MSEVEKENIASFNGGGCIREGSKSCGNLHLHWITTEMRLMMKGDCHQVAKLMMNGCNMGGIQSIAKCQNECSVCKPGSQDKLQKI